MTGGVTLHAAAAWRTEVIASGRLTSANASGALPLLVADLVLRLSPIGQIFASTLRAHRGRAAGRSAATTEASRCEHQLCAASNATSKDFVALRASKDKISAVWET